MDDSTTPNEPVQLEIPSEIRTYLENILIDANISSVDETMHEELLKELYARFDSFLTARIVDNLPPENVEEFIRMNEENRPQEEIQDYLMSKIPNSEQTFAGFFIEFRDRYLGNVLVARSSQSAPAEQDKPTQPVVPQINSEGTDS